MLKKAVFDEQAIQGLQRPVTVGLHLMGVLLVGWGGDVEVSFYTTS